MFSTKHDASGRFLLVIFLEEQKIERGRHGNFFSVNGWNPSLAAETQTSDLDPILSTKTQFSGQNPNSMAETLVFQYEAKEFTEPKFSGETQNNYDIQATADEKCFVK